MLTKPLENVFYSQNVNVQELCLARDKGQLASNWLRQLTGLSISNKVTNVNTIGIANSVDIELRNVYTETC